MDIVLAACADLSHVIVNHPIYSLFGGLVLVIGLLKFYCRLTLGICDCDQDMTGKTVLVTGATAGIGKATAMDMARRNARVILACRNMDKAKCVADEIVASTGNDKVIVKHLNLSSFDSVRKCAEDVLNTVDELHVLINNAGISASDNRMTDDGCEAIFQTNHLSHFLLTLLLLDLLKKSAPSRIINVASGAYIYGILDLDDLAGKKWGGQINLYCRSKLANILFTRELATRLSDSGVTINAIHPGVVKTDIVAASDSVVSKMFRVVMALIGKSSEEGAQTTIHVAVHPIFEKVTGRYLSDCKEKKVRCYALDKTLAKKLFEASEKICGISFVNK